MNEKFLQSMERYDMSFYDRIISRAKREQRTALTEIESKQLLGQAGISVTETKLAGSKKEAVALAREIGFPVALKIASPDIIHKSDCGGVRLGLANAAQVASAYGQIMSSVRGHDPQARIHGVSVQVMAPPGVEVIAGMNRDAQFGPVLMFGLGGIMVEVLQDIALRIVPVTRKDALAMIKEIRGYPLLLGHRGKEAADINSLVELMLQLSSLVENSPEIAEIDLNPVFAGRNGAMAADARVVLESVAEG